MLLALTIFLAGFGIAFSADRPTRSVLILDQSTTNAPWSVTLQSSLQATLKADVRTSVTVYVENLDFGLFGTLQYNDQLRAHLRAKYAHARPNAVIAIGARALDFATQSRPNLWPDTPIIFAAVDEASAAKVENIPNITGSVMRFPLGDLIDAARLVRPDFSRLVIVGDPFERQLYRGHFTKEIAVLRKGLNIVDLTGLPMADLRQRIAALDSNDIVAYTNIYGDGNGLVYTPREALSVLSGIANRPIVVDVETFIGVGSVGGFVVRPGPIGEVAAQLALRILGGEAADQIPISVGNFKKPIFDWRQLERWHIPESRLPEGSEIRFRPPTIWEQYQTQIVLITMALIMLSGLVVGLLWELRHRRIAELKTRQYSAELEQVNRIAMAGVLSASIAHEIAQPLTAIASNGDAGLLWLERKTPNITEAVTALKEIVGHSHRVSEIISAIRALFKRDPTEPALLDVNAIILDILMLVRSNIQKNNITVRTELTDLTPTVWGERTQLQNAIANLIMNAVEAVTSSAGERMIKVRSEVSEDRAIVFVEDSGPGIDEDTLKHIFEAFFTTKANGMGMGLAISKSIIEAHGGRLLASARDGGGVTFSFAFPLSGVRSADPNRNM